MFSTGEFSRIARVSKRMLQYYDEIGLLKPAHTDPQTGYRYYSAQQLPRLNRILALKELGLTLDQIHRMVDGDVSDDEIHGMLLMQKAELEKQLQDDLSRFRRIEARLHRRQNAQPIPDVVIKSVPETPILSTLHTCITPSEGLEFINFLTTALPSQVQKRHLGHFIALLRADGFKQEMIDIEFGFIATGKIPETVVLADDVELTVKHLPAVDQMATIAYVGSPRDSHLGYGALGEWIEQNDYQITGEAREIFVEINTHADEPEAVMEIQIPIEKTTSSNFLQSLSLN